MPEGRLSVLAKAMREQARAGSGADQVGGTLPGDTFVPVAREGLSLGSGVGQRAAIEVLLAPGLAVPSAIASLPYSRVPGEHIGVGDRW
jgi:hypothetical protein